MLFTYASCTTAGCTYDCSHCPDGATTYWRLGETSGTTAANAGAAGAAANGTYQAGVALGAAGATQDANTAVTFNGAANSYVVGTVPVTSNITVEVWAKSTPAAWNQLGFLASARSANGYIIHPETEGTAVGEAKSPPPANRVG